MTPGLGALGHAVSAGDPLTVDNRVLRGAYVAALSAVRRLDRLPAGRQPLLSFAYPGLSLSLGVAGATVAAVRTEARVLRGVLVAAVAGSPSRCLSTPVLSLGDGLKVRRVAAQDRQALVGVVEHQPVGDRPLVMGPDRPVHRHHAAVAPTSGDVTVPGTSRRSGPDPVTVAVDDLVHDPVDDRPSRVRPRHAYNSSTTRTVGRGR